MSSDKEKIKQIEDGFKRLFHKKSASFIAKVITDNEYLCDVEDLNGTKFPEVRKSATEGVTGVLLRLKVGSFVIVSRISDSDELYISMISEIEAITIKSDKITINDGGNGGIIIASKLENEISKTTSSINQLVKATKVIASAVDAIVPGTSKGFDLAVSGMKAADLSDITNNKLIH